MFSHWIYLYSFFIYLCIDGIDTDEKILYTNRGSILISDLSTGVKSEIAETSAVGVAIDYHTTKDYIYWSEVSGGKISRIQYPAPSGVTATVEDIVKADIDNPDGLAVDSVNDHVYWTDTGLDQIMRSDLDGSNKVTIINTGLDEPRAIELDTNERWMYFSDWGDSPKIEKCKFDGSNRHILITNDLVWPNGLTLDINEGRFYWCDANLDYIKSAKFDGSDVQVILQTHSLILHPFDIDLDGDYLYISDWDHYAILKMSKTAGSTPEVVLTESSLPMGLQIYKPNNGGCSNYKVIENEEKRSAGYILDPDVDSSFNDETLLRGWYRIISKNGDAMPTYPPGVKHCGAKHPVWLNGTLPTENDGIVSRKACIQTENSQCETTIDVNVTRCPDGYYVYYLTSSPTNSAFCFGEGEVLCDEGTSSESGYYPGCSSFYPNETITPTVVAGLQEGEVFTGFADGIDPGPSLNPVFDCTFNQRLADQYLYDVHWYIGEDSIISYKNIPITNIGSTYLQEEDWASTHNMNMQVRCAVRVRFSTNSIPSPFYYSPWFAAGVYPLSEELFVVEGESVNITYTSTVPVGCIGSSDVLKSNCHQNLYVYQPNKNGQDGKCKNRLSQKDVVFKTGFCGIQFSTGDWSTGKNLQVFGYSDGLYNFKDRTTYVRLTSTGAVGMWKNINIPEVKVTVMDKDLTISGRMCESYNDPHITTFDGMYYHYMDVGEFIMYRNERGPYWVHALFTNCGYGWPGSSCHCGIAIGSRSSLFVVRTCEKISRNNKYLLRRPQIELKSCNEKDLIIEETGNKFKVTLPIGTEVTFYLRNGFISGITIKPTVFDIENTNGLCGYLSKTKDSSDDFTHRNGQISDDDQLFAASWKIPTDMPDEQLFVSEPTFLSQGGNNDLLNDNTNKESTDYCSCENEAGPNDDVSKFYNVHCNLTEVTEYCLAEAFVIINFRSIGDNAKTLSAFPTVCRTSHVTKRSISSPHIRNIRSTLDTDDVVDNIPLTNDDDVNSNMSEPLTFRNGWTKESAATHCRENISKKIASGAFSELTDFLLDPFIDSCVRDIELTASTVFDEDTIAAIQRKTSMEISRNETLYIQYKDNGNQTEFDYLTGLLCPNNCSNHGVCISGICTCDDLYIWDDCSIQTSVPPENIQIPAEGLCEIRQRECQRTNIYGSFKTSSLWCKRRHFKISNNGKVYTSDNGTVSQASYRNAYMASCELQSGRKRRSTSSIDPEGYDISMSHDGKHFSDSVTIIIFDDNCYTCNATDSTCELLDICSTTSETSQSGSRIGIIAGTVCGTVLLICVVLVVLVWKCKADHKCEPIKTQFSMKPDSMLFVKRETTWHTKLRNPVEETRKSSDTL